MYNTTRKQALEYSRHYRTNTRGFAHWGFVATLVVFALLSLTYSVILPLGEAADETDHFDLIRFIARQGRPPLTLEERESIGPKGDSSPFYHGLVVLLTQHVDVSELPELPHTEYRTERFIPSDGFRGNKLLHTENEAFPFRGIVLAWHLARLVSIPLGMATVIAIYLTALAIYPTRRHLALGVACFAAFLPRFVTSSAVVNDDNLVVPLVAFTVYRLVRVMQGDERRRTFVILGVLMGLAAISKYHGLVLVPEMTIALAVLAWRDRWGWRTLLRRWGWTMLAFTLTAGWWFAFLIVRFNQVSELGWIRGLMAPLGDPVVTLGFGHVLDLVPDSGPDFELGWSDWARSLFNTFWISYGWNHVLATPGMYRILGLVSLIAALGLAKHLARTWRTLRSGGAPKQYSYRLNTPEKPGWRPEMLLIAFHFFVYLGVVVLRFLLRPAPETAQGRHMYPALMAVAIFFVLGLSESLWLLRRLPGKLLHNFPRAKDTSWARSDPASPEGIFRLDRALAVGIGGALVTLSIITPPLFILPVYIPYLPIITADPSQVPIPHRLEASFGPGLDFEGYGLTLSELEAGQALPVTLYWYAGARQERDYLVRVCLQNAAGEEVSCRQGHPVDGRYPMRAWEIGYLIRDEMNLPAPACLTPGYYELMLSVLPLRLDTAFTTIDEEAKIAPPLRLARVALSPGKGAPPDNVELWIGKERHSHGEIELKQIRQAMTVIIQTAAHHQPGDSGPSVRLIPVGAGRDSESWTPIIPELAAYRCPDDTIVSVHNFLVDQETRPGRYYLELRDQIKGELLITVLTRLRDFSSPSNIPTQSNASIGGEVKLLGYGVDLSPRWPGETIDVTGYWQSLRTMSRHHIVSLHLLDNAMNTWGQSDQLLGSHYPNVLWAPGENVSEVYPLPINVQTPAGLYTIEFGVYDYTSGVFDFLPITTAPRPEPVEHLYLGQVRVMDPARTRPPDHPTLVELGNEIQLVGYDLSSSKLRPDEALHLTLHWQAIKQPTADYTVFTQLVGPDGLVWGQQDNQPQGGRYATSAWDVQDRVVDRYELTLQEGSPPGEYRLLVGMYNLATGQRLIAIGEDRNRLPDDAILLTTISMD